MLVLLIGLVEGLVCLLPDAFICTVDEFCPGGVCKLLSPYFTEVQVDVVDIHEGLVITFSVGSIKAHDPLFLV